MAYQLLGDMRVKLYDKLERLAPAYLLRRRSGDLVALATQDVEMIEYFYAHTIGPAVVSLLVPLTVLGFLAAYSWPVALALLPFLAYALFAPLRGRRRIDALGDKARAALGEMSAHVTDTIQGLGELTAFQATGRRRAQFLALAERYGLRRLDILGDLSGQGARFEVAMGLGGSGRRRRRRDAGVGRRAGRGHAAFADPDRAGDLPARIGNFAGQPPVGRYRRRGAPPVRRQPMNPNPSPTVRIPRRGRPRACRWRSTTVGFTYPGNREATLKNLGFTVPAGAMARPLSARPVRARAPWPACCCGSGTRSKGRSAWAVSTCAS